MRWNPNASAFARAMAEGHRRRTGHELAGVEVETGTPGVTRLERTCCGVSHERDCEAAYAAMGRVERDAWVRGDRVTFRPLPGQGPADLLPIAERLLSGPAAVTGVLAGLVTYARR